MGYAEVRIEWLRSVSPRPVFESSTKVLVSGAGAGSEMLAARKFGAGYVAGLEVDQALVEVARARLAAVGDMTVLLYDGNESPVRDGAFDFVLSGHVIEHTRRPKDYLLELLRVCGSGGVVFLEFPSRYHKRELHTGLVSAEWLPLVLRNLAYRIVTATPVGVDSEVRRRADLVRRTLMPVSLREVKRWSAGGSGRVIAWQVPVPGVIRCAILKD